MSDAAWIKMQKSLADDPRVRRIARGLAQRGEWASLRHVTLVTLVCGALYIVWRYADTFARHDDTLEVTTAEIDELTGIKNFSDLLPADWLEILDEECVKLPNFQSHNGTVARRQSLDAKRASRYRARKRDATVTNVTPSRDQTRPDQDHTRPRPEKNPSAAAPPTNGSWMTEFKLLYPNRGGDQGWRRAERAAHARLAEGHKPQEFLEGAQRYRTFCEATGKIGTEYVKQAATFLGPEKPFLEPWALPATKADVRLTSNLAAADEFMRRTEEP